MCLSLDLVLNIPNDSAKQHVPLHPSSVLVPCQNQLKCNLYVLAYDVIPLIFFKEAVSELMVVDYITEQKFKLCVTRMHHRSKNFSWNF